MIQARFVDDSTIEVTAPDGEIFTWKTYFPVPKQNQQYFAGRFPYYYQKYFEGDMSMSVAYWIWIKMNYDEGLGIYGGDGDREDERILLSQERERIGARIRELRKEKNIEAKMLAQIANIDAANLSRIEQGRYSVGLDILSKIAFALGAKIELIDFVEPKNSNAIGNINHFEKER
ncbi:helix-turn-helix domain-containing protein [Pinibacter aurantiacus]|uniref:Helix-turn-helix transcriptional regulator n=1 Tax=Pinibacter aurantiacus TaxID=2851599 RepID=A0A9E2S727_9BACT|nr:helix-turn-helix transcriptional regulator [Pinibacter aurantiacus]MBV4357366.1 helix-turn-helix transcriptional regulator [Pinibacter aurantiacus]